MSRDRTPCGRYTGRRHERDEAAGPAQVCPGGIWVEAMGRQARSWPLGRILALAVVLGLVAGQSLLGPPVARAKEIDVVGTVECGQRSGRRCDIGDTLVVLSDSLSGRRERVQIDVSWVRADLPALDQDDEVTVVVEFGAAGHLQALRVVRQRQSSGSVNPGLSTGSYEITEGRSDRGAAQDRDRDPAPSILVTPTPVTPTPGPGTPTPTPIPGTGTIAGVVVDGTTAAPIAGATIRFDGQSVVADGSGRLTLTNLAAGTVTLDVSAPGYVPQRQAVAVVAGMTSQILVALPPIQPAIAITLSWSPRPPDLDAHLSGPGPGGGRFHVSFLNRDPVPYASLIRDGQTGFGPEQIVIRPDPGTGLFVPGEYRFWVHNFSGSPEYDVSQGRAAVTQGTNQLGLFLAGGASGDPALDLWHVVNLTIDAAGNATLAPIQRFVGGSESTVLAQPPYGSK